MKLATIDLVPGHGGRYQLTIVISIREPISRLRRDAGVGVDEVNRLVRREVGKRSPVPTAAGGRQHEPIPPDVRDLVRLAVDTGRRNGGDSPWDEAQTLVLP